MTGSGISGTGGMESAGIGAETTGKTADFLLFSVFAFAGLIRGFVSVSLAEKSDFTTKKIKPPISRNGKSAIINGTVRFGFIFLCGITNWRFVDLGKITQLRPLVKFVDGFLGEIKTPTDVHGFEPALFPPAPH